MASAPHCVTTSVSLVSLVSVNAMMMKNLIEPIKRNLWTSSGPWIGKSVRRAFLHEKGCLVLVVVAAESLSAAVVTAATVVAGSSAVDVDVAVSEAVPSVGGEGVSGSEGATDVSLSEFPSPPPPEAGSIAAPPRKRAPDRVDMFFICSTSGVLLGRNANLLIDEEDSVDAAGAIEAAPSSTADMERFLPSSTIHESSITTGLIIRFCCLLFIDGVGNNVAVDLCQVIEHIRNEKQVQLVVAVLCAKELFDGVTLFYIPSMIMIMMM